MDGMYILRTFTSWYSIGVNQMMGSESEESAANQPRSAKPADASNVADLFDDLKDYATGNKDKELWVDRSTCHITESLVPLTEDEPTSETRIHAFLGIVEVLNTYHLGVVTRSEVVADLDLGDASFNRRKRSKVLMIKEVRFLPMQSDTENVCVVTSTEDLGASLNSQNMANLGNVTNVTAPVPGPAGNAEQMQLLLEVQKIIENMEKILATGYYYSYDTDLTNSLQNLYLKRHVPFPQNLEFGGSITGAAREILLRNDLLYNMSNPDFNWCVKTSQNIPKHWTTVLIQGYVGYSINYLNEQRLEILIIGRRNVKRSGTRFVARGIDEDGNVGNFVESEVRMRLGDGTWYSFLQNRGSVPVFWEQVNMTSPVTLYNYHHNIRSFSKHIDIFKEFYEPCTNFLFLNLLDVKENEKVLTESFMHVVDEYNSSNRREPSASAAAGDRDGPTSAESCLIELVNYNYNLNAKWSTHEILVNYILDSLEEQVDRIGYFDAGAYLNHPKNNQRHKLTLVDPLFDGPETGPKPLVSLNSSPDPAKDGEGDSKSHPQGTKGLQRGMVRTNCLDCLDRTNIFQWVLSWVVVNKMLNNHFNGHLSHDDRKVLLKERLLGRDAVLREDNFLFNAFTDLWCDHGDHISIHYSGTQSTLSERVKQANTSINSIFHYSKTMVQRLYHSLFQDNQRQVIFNILSPYQVTPTTHKQQAHRQADDLLLLEEDRVEEASEDYKEIKRKLMRSKYYIQDPIFEDAATDDAPKAEQKEPDNIFDRLNSEISKLLVSYKSAEPEQPKDPQEVADKAAPRSIEGSPASSYTPADAYVPDLRREDVRELKIWTGSWNIGAHVVDVNENLLNWMELKKVECDLYVFSFQEFVELNFINIATGRRDENKEYEFENLIANLFKFSTDHKYVKLTSISMTGLYLVIFVKQALRPYMLDVLVTNVKTGLNYNIGNKGCVGLQFRLFDHRLSFLNLHLNFGKNLPVGRIELIDYIIKNAFKDYNRNVMDNDLFVMAGDFNFQIQLEKQIILNLLKKMEFAKLFNYDEFNMAKMIGIPILNRLYEPQIQFHPTYKYKDGTKYYTTKRSPAWCDRIIFGGKMFDTNKVTVLSYKRNDNLIMSDHRPISSIILVDLTK